MCYFSIDDLEGCEGIDVKDMKRRSEAMRLRHENGGGFTEEDLAEIARDRALVKTAVLSLEQKSRESFQDRVALCDNVAEA